MARPRKERLIKGFARVREQLVEALEGCNDEEFTWKPRPDMKSVQEMLRECGTIETIIVTYAQTEEQLEFETAVPWKGDNLKVTMKELEKIRGDTLQYIETLSEEELDATRLNPRGEETEIEEFLRSIYIHEYYHVGQIIYNRWLLGHNPYNKASV